MSKSKYDNLTQRERLIVEALENPKFTWRTLDGLVKETKLEEDKLKEMLHQLGEKGLMLKTINPNDAKFVYTTPDHYTKTHNFIQITLSAATASIIF